MHFCFPSRHQPSSLYGSTSSSLSLYSPHQSHPANIPLISIRPSEPARLESVFICSPNISSSLLSGHIVEFYFLPCPLWAGATLLKGWPTRGEFDCCCETLPISDSFLLPQQPAKFQPAAALSLWFGVKLGGAELPADPWWTNSMNQKQIFIFLSHVNLSLLFLPPPPDLS